jgi:hypothetical protein
VNDNEALEDLMDEFDEPQGTVGEIWDDKYDEQIK